MNSFNQTTSKNFFRHQQRMDWNSFQLPFSLIACLNRQDVHLINCLRPEKVLFAEYDCLSHSSSYITIAHAQAMNLGKFTVTKASKDLLEQNV